MPENMFPLSHKGLPALQKRKSSRVLGNEKCAKMRSFLSNKGLTVLQRGCRHVATGRSLQCNKGPVAEPGGRHGSPDPALSKRDRGQHDCKHLYNNVLQKQ